MSILGYVAPGYVSQGYVEDAKTVITLGSLTLPEGLRWEDEFEWPGREQATGRTLGGKLIVQGRRLRNGRPITLAGGATYGWITRGVLIELLALAELNDPMILSLHDGRVFTVIFDLGQRIEAERVLPKSNPTPDDLYKNVKIPLMTV